MTAKVSVRCAHICYGFQWMATSTFNMVVGREGRTLRDKWQERGTKTFLGLHSKGFPNLFLISGPQVVAAV